VRLVGWFVGWCREAMALLKFLGGLLLSRRRQWRLVELTAAVEMCSRWLCVAFCFLIFLPFLL